MSDFKPYILISIIQRRGRRNHFPLFLDKSDIILVFCVFSVVLNFKMGHLFTIIKGTQKTALQMWPEFLGKACGFTALGNKLPQSSLR